MFVDLHVHSNNSDGKYDIDTIVKTAQERKMNCISITDHDYITKIENCTEVKMIHGTEITTMFLDRRIHILVYDFEINSRFADTVDKLRLQNRRMYINSLKRSNKISFIKKYIEIGELLSLVEEAKGFCVLAHPGRLKLKPEELSHFISKLQSLGLDGIECYHSDHSIEETDFLVSLAKNNNLLITGGSDFHGMDDKCIGEVNNKMMNLDNVIVDMNNCWKKKYLSENEMKVDLKPFWNCHGTYIYYLLRKVKGESIIFQIISSLKIYHDFPDIQYLINEKQYEKNPWIFQPIKLILDDNRRFDFESCLSAALKENGINEVVYDKEKIEDLHEFISNNIKFGKILINVDEYYIPYKKKFYCNKHNKHFILIDKMLESKYLIVDSDFTDIQLIDCYDLERAFYSDAYKNMKCIVYSFADYSSINMNNSIHNSNYSFYAENKWKKGLLNYLDLASQYNNEELLRFIIEGIHYNLKFKIIPYLQSFETSTDEFDDSLKKEIDSLIELSMYLLYYSKKKHIDYVKLKERINSKK